MGEDMMKKFMALILAAIIAALLCSCSGGKTLPDAPTLAAALASGLDFDEELEDSGADIAYSFYGVDEAQCKSAALYKGSSASVDEVAVFECVDADAANAVAALASERQQYLHDGYSNYGPEQVPKIDSGVIKTVGNTVIFCISNSPEKIDSIIDASRK